MRRFHGLSRRWLETFFSYGSMHLVSLLIPLLAFPWLGRVLEPESFGLLMYMCLFPPLLALLVDWGFPLGGARMAASLRGNRDALTDLLGEITSAKICLAFLAFITALILMPFVPHAIEWPDAYILAVMAGIGRGLSPLWFYQGTRQRLKWLALGDMTASLAVLSLVFIFIREPGQWSYYLFFIASCKLFSNVMLTLLLRPAYPFRLRLTGIRKVLLGSSALFGGLFSATAYHYCFQLVLGYVLTVQEMGIIVALDKMLRALTGLLTPFTQTIFPEVCILWQREPGHARRILRLSLLLTFIVSSLLAFLVWLLAPFLIRVALGQAYANAAEIMRIMLLAVPFATAGQVLGTQVLVPMGEDKRLAWIRVWVTIASIPAAAIIGYLYGLWGGAFVPLLVEATLCFSFLRVAGARRGELR